MALGARDGVFLLLGYLMVLGCMDRMMVAEAQAPITCSLPSDSTISLNYCTYSDQSNTANQTTDCQGYLSDVEDSPSKLCCTGVNNVAYYKTACICMATFYPPATVNATRQLQLPRLCNVTTDLCGQCPSFIVAKTTAVPISSGSSNATASKAGAIGLAVVLGFVLVAAIVAFSILGYRKWKARQSSGTSFQGAPPGGAF